MSGYKARHSLGACLVFSLVFFGQASDVFAATDAALWNALRTGGHVALMRHAYAPGIGDPADFVLEDCSTQRNLSEEGREQAKRIGDRFRANRVESAKVYSSQWCRCLETARLLDLGAAMALPKANSFYQNMGRQGAQTDAMTDWIAGRKSDGTTIIVTHQVNITALTGRFVDSGEMVVIKQNGTGKISVLGTIETN